MLLSVGTYLIASNIMFCGSILTAPTYIIIFKLASIFNGKSVFVCKIISLLVTRMGVPTSPVKVKSLSGTIKTKNRNLIQGCLYITKDLFIKMVLSVLHDLIHI